MYKTVILQTCGEKRQRKRPCWQPSWLTARVIALGCPFMRIKSKKALADARRRYDEGAPLAGIAAMLGLNAREFLVYRRAQDWPLRTSPIRRATRERPPPPDPARSDPSPADTAPPEPAPPAVAIDMAELRLRLERAVEGELSAVETRLSGDSVAAGERNARLLASLVKTFAELRRMEALENGARNKAGAGEHGAEDGDEPAPRDLDALRHELARTVERIAREGQAG